MLQFFRPDHSRCDREIQRLQNQVSDLNDRLEKQQKAHVDEVSKLLEHYMGLATPENLQAFRYDPAKRAEAIKTNSAQFTSRRPTRFPSAGPQPYPPYQMHGPMKKIDRQAEEVINKAIERNEAAPIDQN